MKRDAPISIQNMTKGNLPERLPFQDMKDAVLGSSYDLSIAFVGNDRARTLNRKHREKDAPTNILSFPLDEQEGELVLCLPLIEKEAIKYGVDRREYIAYLFIHGLHHLKGLNHGSTMEKQEAKIRAEFGISIS